MSRHTHRSDEVDRICADWKRERPNLDTAPLQVFSRVTRLARHLEIARRRGVKVVEDCAQCVGGSYHGKRLGPLGDVGIYGFWSMMLFLGVLTIGFIYEWKKGALEWE